MYFNFNFIGASSGIGFETAKDLSKRGAKVLMLCRDTEGKAAKAKKEIVQVRIKNALCRIASFASQFLPGDPWKSGRVQVGPLFTEVCQGVCQANKAQGGQSPFLGQQCWCCGKCISGILLQSTQSWKGSDILDVPSLDHRGWIWNAFWDKPPWAFPSHWAADTLAEKCWFVNLNKNMAFPLILSKYLHRAALENHEFRPRIVIVSSIMHRMVQMRWDDLQWTKEYSKVWQIRQKEVCNKNILKRFILFSSPRHMLSPS